MTADRSTAHRAQLLRIADGAPLDCTQPGAVWGPYGLALHPDGATLYVADANNDRVLALDSRDLRQRRLEIGSAGTLPGQLDRPRGIATLQGGEQIAVADMGNARINVYATHDGSYLRCFGDAASHGETLPLRQPYGVLALDQGASILVSEYEGRRLVLFAVDGTPLQVLSPPGVGALGGLVADGERWIYALDAEKGRVLALTTTTPAPLGEVASSGAHHGEGSSSLEAAVSASAFGVRLAQTKAAAQLQARLQGLHISALDGAAQLRARDDADGSPSSVIGSSEAIAIERRRASAQRRNDWLQLKQCMCTEERCALCLPL